MLAAYGVIGIAVILFCETGLLIGLVLPGETLTLLAGAFSHGHQAGQLHPALGLVILAAAVGAVTGGQFGYVLGRKLGSTLLDRPDRWILKRRYVERTHDQFARFGAETVLVARFVPFVRTIVSPAAGIGAMPVTRFTVYNLIGGVLWAVVVTLIGYGLGGVLSIDRYKLPVTLAIVLLSLLPLGLHRWRSSWRSARRPPSSLE